MATKIIRRAGKNLTIFWLKPVKSGRMDLWSSFSITLLKVRMRAGRTVTEPITPRTTPLAITRPRSNPKPKVIKQRARKPATVVAEPPKTDAKAALMAFSMAAVY